MSRACCKWLAVNQWSNLFTQCFSQSKQIFVHCAHEILNWLWYKKGNPMRIKIATWYRGTAHHEQWYVLVSVCDQNLFHSAKLNRGNYRCEHSMSHLRCPSAFNEIRCLGKSSIAICVDPCGYSIREIGHFRTKSNNNRKMWESTMKYTFHAFHVFFNCFWIFNHHYGYIQTLKLNTVLFFSTKMERCSTSRNKIHNFKTGDKNGANNEKCTRSVFHLI